MDDYKYLFPYEKVPTRTKILIYGAGKVGMAYLHQMLITKYCDVLAMVDRNAKEYIDLCVPVIEPSRIKYFKFDYIIIAVRVATNHTAMKNVLIEQGIKEEKIICSEERNTDISFIDSYKLPSNRICETKDELSIAFMLTGGLGDIVIHKKLIMQIIEWLPECRIDLFYSSGGDFVRYLFSDCANIRTIIPDLGYQYSQLKNIYALSIELFTTRYAHIDKIKPEIIKKNNKEFLEKISNIQSKCNKEAIDSKTLLHTIQQRRIYQGLNAYTSLDYGGILGINNNSVTIPLLESAFLEFKKMQLGKYITLNYGNGTCKDEKSISKMWPFEYFSKLAIILKKIFPHIQIVQLGDAKAKKLNNIDQYVLGAKFPTVAHILKHSILHIDIEGGLVHIATQLSTKCIVLFGPTPEEYIGYDTNINLKVGNCHNCFGLYDNVYQCAKGMEHPSCMYDIKPEFVAEKAIEYINSVLHD